MAMTHFTSCRCELLAKSVLSVHPTAAAYFDAVKITNAQVQTLLEILKHANCN